MRCIMNKKYSSSVAKNCFVSLGISFLLWATLFFANIEVQLHVGYEIIVGFTILVCLLIFYYYHVTIELTADEIRFSRLTGVYRTISMSEPLLYFTSIKNINSKNQEDWYSVLVLRNETSTKRYKLPLFKKPTVNAMMEEFRELRRGSPSYSSIKGYTLSEEGPVFNSNSFVFYSDKDLTIQGTKRRFLHACIFFVIYTCFILPILYQIFVVGVNAPTGNTAVSNLLFFWLVNCIYILYRLVKLPIQLNKIKKCTPTTVTVYPDYIKFDDKVFSVDKITHLLLPRVDIHLYMRGFTIEFIYENKKYTYYLQLNVETNSPEYTDIIVLCSSLYDLITKRIPFKSA